MNRGMKGNKYPLGLPGYTGPGESGRPERLDLPDLYACEITVLDQRLEQQLGAAVGERTLRSE